MGLLQTLGGGQGYLKAGFLGFPKSGKTWTAMLLACGTRDMFSLPGAVAMFDTEGGSEYIAREILKRTGQPMIGVRSRKFDDLIAVGHEAEKNGIAVLIVDSITHPWRELCDAYLKQLNEQRIRKHKDPQTRLEFQDWQKIKPKWAKWTEFYLNSKLHVIICGRAGFEYDFEEREDGSGKDLVKTGVTMKTEGEFGFEPSLLVQMERVQIAEDGGKRFKGFTHRATVIGDRFNVLDGATADEPDFPFFAPHLKMLTPGAHAPVNAEPGSDFGLDAEGDDAYGRERKLRVILCEKAQAELLLRWPGQTAKEKKAKVDAIREAFATTSWTEVETRLDSAALQRGLETIQAMPMPTGGEKEVA